MLHLQGSRSNGSWLRSSTLCTSIIYILGKFMYLVSRVQLFTYTCRKWRFWRWRERIRTTESDGVATDVEGLKRGVTDRLQLLLWAERVSNSLVCSLTLALLVLGAPFFIGEAKCFPRVRSGLFRGLASGKCRQHTREWGQICSSVSWNTFNHKARLSGLLGKRW